MSGKKSRGGTAQPVEDEMVSSPTVSSRIMERTKAQVSMVQERTVSVRPSRNNRVMEASYVRQNFPLS